MVCDPQRLRALRSTALLDTPAEAAFDRLTSLGARVLGAPIALVSLVGDERQFLKSAYGVPAAMQNLPLSHSVCRHLIETRSPLIVSDARESPLLRDHPAIGEFGVIAYAGVPLMTGDGHILGSFCLIDRQPRRWSDEEVAIIADLAAATMSEINLRCERDQARQARDEILERRHEMAALRARATALERSNADLEHFAYLASHDLQEPLRMVRGFLDLVQRRGGALDPHVGEWVDSAAQGALRMQRMIQDMLAYARLDCVPRGDLVCDSDRALDDALHILASKLVQAQGRIERGPLLPVVCTHSQLVQLFQNLVGNAIKYRGEESPRIAISARRVDGAVEFTIADNGLGIAPEQAPMIFDLFCRLPCPGPRDGTGLGLAICKRIVERHGGRIRVEAGDPQGSIFRFTLPGADRGG